MVKRLFAIMRDGVYNSRYSQGGEMPRARDQTPDLFTPTDL